MARRLNTVLCDPFFNIHIFDFDGVVYRASDFPNGDLLSVRQQLGDSDEFYDVTYLARHVGNNVYCWEFLKAEKAEADRQ